MSSNTSLFVIYNSTKINNEWAICNNIIIMNIWSVHCNLPKFTSSTSDYSQLFTIEHKHHETIKLSEIKISENQRISSFWNTYSVENHFSLWPIDRFVSIHIHLSSMKRRSPMIADKVLKYLKLIANFKFYIFCSITIFIFINNESYRFLLN